MLAEHMTAQYVVCFCLFVYLLAINLMTLSFCPQSRTILEIYYGPSKDSVFVIHLANCLMTLSRSVCMFQCMIN